MTLTAPPQRPRTLRAQSLKAVRRRVRRRRRRRRNWKGKARALHEGVCQIVRVARR
jgi:hypothetical protein